MLRIFSVAVCAIIWCKRSQALNFNAICPGVAIPVCQSYNAPEPDYYWRPYNGDIPDDAIAGGHDASSNVTYVGQIPLTAFAALNPATIRPGEKGALTSYQGHFYNDNSVKILCSQHKENFEWIQTTTDDLHLLTDYYIIEGGFEFVSNRYLRVYVGRLLHSGSVILGKVFTNESIHRGIKIPAPNGHEIESQSFELLVYRKRK